MPVTAQDVIAILQLQIRDSILDAESRGWKIVDDINALLSRARQEERHKYAKEVRAFMNDVLEVAKESEIQRAKQEARREALKEMDEAWLFTCFNSPDEDTKTNPVETLRQEYSNQP